ncbi:MAG: InlB B-repeat-containing protein, partial [Clostridia bacterium]|nr:InlB B-repeat-containing protein [Clostridia bacterium]
FTKTCTKTEHAHGDGSCTYGCGLTEHTHTDFCYNCGLKTHTHGDGNCNANACTNPSHHTHNDTCLGCGYAGEHVHTADCPYGLVCTKPEHRHTNDDRTYKIVKIIQAKYGQTIVDEWNFTTSGGLVYPKTTTTTSWDPVSDTELTQRLAFVAVMPGRNLVFNHHSTSNSKRSYNYYIECLPGETGAATYGGKNYKHYLSNGTLTVDFNSWTRAEDFFPIDGFTANVATNNGSTISGSSTTLGSNATVNMYYTRNSYTLDFFNADGSIISSQSVPFEQNIKSYADALGTPPYPSTLEENAYEFVGWYTTSGCYNGSELKDTEKMPAGNFAVYAKWVPLTHHVRFFETYDDMLAYEASVAAGTPDESLVYVKPTAPDVEYSIETSHGSYIGSIPNPDKLRVTNPGGSVTEYDFGGWFFIQNGSKKAYTPLDMPVTRDLNVFADWGSHSAQPYVVHYALDEAETDTHFLNLLPRASLTYADLTQTVTYNDEARTYVCLNDGGDTYGWHRVVANDTMGYAYQGTTRTFTAKAGDPFNQLFEGFNVHYFPTVSSHSITVAFEESSVDPRINTFTFRYVQVPNVSYTVRYINSDTGAIMSEPKTVTTTSAVVTERFKVFSGFVPDAFYKQLVLAVAPDPDHPGQWTSSPDNVITFYYSENTSSARYTVHFLLQKNGEEARTLTDADYAVSFAADGTYTFSNKFEESGSRVDGVSDKDVNTQISPIDFAGYDLVSNKALEVRGQQNGTWAQNTPTYSGGKYTIFPVMYGTDLFLFYQREEYAYKVYYLLYGTPVTPADLVNYTTVAADTETPKRVLADTTSGTALYGSSYTATALEIPGYTCVTNKTITKDITPSVSNNYIVFFYTPLQYTVQYKVWKNGGGTVSNGNETFSDPSTLLGSTATASAGYTFAGWFVDADCTIPATYNPTYNPQGMGTTYEDSTKTTPNTFGAYVFPNVACLTANGTESFAGNIFYAKFNPEFGDLKVRRENSENQGMGEQVFQYEVKNNQTGEVVNITITGDGEVTIKDIAVGTYTVTQVNDWSHRWVDAPKTATVTATTPGLAVFGDSAVNDKWLNGNSPVAKNVKGATA